MIGNLSLLPASSHPSCHRPIHCAPISPYPTQHTGIEQRPPLVRECPNVPMRLLNTTTFELEDFLGENTPEYAILSHTWGEEEIIFQDLSAQARSLDEPWKTKKSFKKVSGFCSLANENGYQWCWIDTCCIDKTSSAELSEAINSMFRW